MKRIDTDSDFATPPGYEPGTGIRSLEGTVGREFLSEPVALQDLANEIEASNGLILMTTLGATSQLGIKRTAQIIAALRATPQPTPDAAEGAGLDQEGKPQDRSDPSRSIAERSTRTATPKPAPDAMLAATCLRAICVAGNRCACANKDWKWRDHRCEADMARVKSILDCMPSPDGAGIRKAALKVIDHEIASMIDMDAHPVVTKSLENVRKAIAAIPSATGAASPPKQVAFPQTVEDWAFHKTEPVAHYHHPSTMHMGDCAICGNIGDHPLHIVREGQEAIARIIDPVTFELLKLPSCECDPNIISSWNRALTKADAILSLRVQPGAGEREVIEHLKQAASFADENSSESIRLDERQAWAAHARSIRGAIAILSSQAPQSSSDKSG